MRDTEDPYLVIKCAGKLQKPKPEYMVLTEESENTSKYWFNYSRNHQSHNHCRSRDLREKKRFLYAFLKRKPNIMTQKAERNEKNIYHILKKPHGEILVSEKQIKTNGSEVDKMIPQYPL